MMQLKFDEPYFLRNLVIHPIVGGNGGNFLTVEEARERGLLTINDTGQVNEVDIDFGGGGGLFVLDGEEIVGALQNRVFNTSMVATNPVRKRVPVTCVEQNRWSGDRIFSHSDVVAYPSLRSILASSVTQSVKKSRSFKADQQAVWKSVKSTLKSFQVRSMTSSMHDVFSTLKDEIERFIEDVEFPENTRGFIAVAGNKILGMDVFAGPGLFKKLQEKLLRGYALEALTMMDRRGQVEMDKIKDFTNYLFSRDYIKTPGVIEGEEWRYADRKVAAHMLKKDEEVIHFAGFPLT